MTPQTIIQVSDEATFVARYERQQRRSSCVDLHEYPIGCDVLPRKKHDLDPLADELCPHLKSDLPHGSACRLVIPAGWCLIHVVDLPEDKWDDQAALFEFEQFVPVDLESLTCAVGRLDRKRAVVVGVFTDPLAGLIERIEACNIVVEDIVVDVLLLGGSIDADRGSGTHGLALLDERHISLAVLNSSSGELAQIHNAASPATPDVEQVKRQIAGVALSSAASCAHWKVLTYRAEGVPAELLQAFAADGVTAEAVDRPASLELIHNAALSADVAVNLRSGALASPGQWLPVQRRLQRCAVALAVFLLIFCVRLRFQNLACVHGAEELRPLRSAVYAEVYPGESAPPEAALRLRSERIKLEGLTDATGGDGGEPRRPGSAVLEFMQGVAEHIPAKLKLHVTELMADDESMTVAGRTSSHGAAGDLVQALNRAPGLAAEPPRTKLRKDGTVDFRMTIVRSTEADD